MDQDEISNLNRGPSIDASHQVPPSFGSFGLAVSEEKIFRNLPTRNKNCLWRPCLLMDQNQMSNLNRGPSIDAPYQVSVQLAKRFQRRNIFQKSTYQKQELPMVAMFVNGSERNCQSFSYKVSVHLAKQFQRRKLKCEKITDDRRWQKLKF